MNLKKITSALACLVVLLTVSACSETRYAAHLAKNISMPQDKVTRSKGYFKVGSSYKIQGKRYYPSETYNHTETGVASWYGPGFHGKLTANGEIFDENELTAAHRTLQLPSIVRVTNLSNGRSVILRVNDRGPFAHDRILDVSKRAANVLGFKNKGVTKIRLEVVADASREVAAVAKSGRSTRGFEIAYNQGKRPAVLLEDQTPLPLSKPGQEPEPVTQIALGQTNSVDADGVAQNNIPQRVAQVPTVESEPLSDVLQNSVNITENSYIQNAGKVFVQAGSFSEEANALSFSHKLSQIGPSKVYMTRVNNQPYFRVRLGPYNNSKQAQDVLASLAQNGHQHAVIITE